MSRYDSIITPLWGDRHHRNVMVAIEARWLLALAKVGAIKKAIPPDLVQICLGISSEDSFHASVEEHESKIGHDVAAMVDVLEMRLKNCGLGRMSRFVHFGLTSSDVSDTALSVTFRDSFNRLLLVLRGVSSALRHGKKSAVFGRTHGVRAEVIDNKVRMTKFAVEIEGLCDKIAALTYYGKFSGATGNYGIRCQRYAEELLLSQLAMVSHPAATQVIPRQVYAEYASLLAIIGKVLARIAVSFRVGLVAGDYKLSRSGEKGSSAMPHKVNPWRLERISGMSRLLTAYAGASIDNIELWLERDISHSSVERVSTGQSFDMAITMCEDLKRTLHSIAPVPVVGRDETVSQRIMNILLLYDVGTRADCHDLARLWVTHPERIRTLTLKAIPVNALKAIRKLL